MIYVILADLVVAIHIAYVSYVLVGELAILLGIVLRWSWIRNPWFRWTHLIAIVIVALEAILGITCPLTDLEDALRRWGHQEAPGTSFIGRCLDSILFYAVPDWILMLC